MGSLHHDADEIGALGEGTVSERRLIDSVRTEVGASASRAVPRQLVAPHTPLELAATPDESLQTEHDAGGTTTPLLDVAAEFIAAQPNGPARLLELHQPDRSGRCRGCTQPGYGTPRDRWPCIAVLLARAAVRRLQKS